MTEVFRVVGPPGCGKTTWAARQAKNAVEKYGPDGVLLLSLTRAGAREIGSRDTGVDEEMCGTMHSFCYKMADGKSVPQKSHLLGWAKLHPQWAISPSVIGSSSERLSETTGFGDDMYRAVDILRNRRVDRSEWTGQQRDFIEKWEDWLDDEGLIDFTGMLEQVANDKKPYRMSIGAIIADEVQDFSALELEVLFLWARFAEKLVLVGDLHQSLYAFRGASSEVFEGEAFTVLEQSYRVPKAHHAIAERVMGAMHSIPPVEFRPKDHEGEVLRHAGTWKRFESFIPDIEREVNAGRTVMVIASCGYMVSPALKVLRAAGIPFWNPYTATSGAWNPLTPKLERGQKSTVQRIGAYMRGNWLPSDLKDMTKLFVNVWQRGGKDVVESLLPTLSAAEVQAKMSSIFKPEAMESLYAGTHDLHEVRHLFAASLQQQVSYIIRIVERFGNRGLMQNPRVVVGTIHSVKGGEADTVILFPDLSRAWWDIYNQYGWDGRDALLRLFYVGVTRSKDRLIIGQPAGKRYIQGV